MKIALVQDWLVTLGGAEKVLAAIASKFPGDIYTLVADKKKLESTPFAKATIHTSFVQKLPKATTKYRSYLPLFPLAIEQFDLGNYDLVISSSHCVAKGVLTHAEQFHVCYCHTPMRYGWDLYQQYLRGSGLKKGVKGFLAKFFLHYLRLWDAHASSRVDCYIASSNYIAKRIAKTYQKKAHVIYPPVDVKSFSVESAKDEYYLTASRLVPYKKIDLIVEAFSQMPDRRLIVAGDGPEMGKIKQKAGKNTLILGRISDELLQRYMQKARAFVFAAIEDFGIVPIEAQACGTPVIALGKGAICETVIDGKTGILFKEQTAKSLIDAVKAFEKIESGFDPFMIRKHAEKFSVERFQDAFTAFVMKKYEEFKE